MRAWLWTVLTITLAVLVAFLIHRYPGNVLIVVDQWRVQVSLAFSVLLILGGFAAFYMLLRVLVWVNQLPDRYRGWRGQRQQRREQSMLEQGWTALLEGRYSYAEKTLTRVSGESSDRRRQVLALLSAARAAHEISEFDRQDSMLEQAQRLAALQSADVDLNTAVAAAAADLWLQQGKALQALGALQVDHVQPMRHLHTMRLMLRIYQQLQQHDKVLELARALQRKHALSAAEANKIIEASAAAQLRGLKNGDWQASWKELRSDEKDLPEVALIGAQLFQASGNLKESTKILEAALKENFDPRLLAAYAKAEPEQVTPRLQKAEHWLEQRKDKGAENADLLATVGALCLAAQMWGQAQRYLEQAARMRNDARVHALLGSLFDRIGEPGRAAQHWRLATAVSAALPTLAQDVVLPAANTESDPVIAQTEGLDLYVQDIPSEESVHDITAQSGSSGYDEFFDSAPVPIHHFESIDEQAQIQEEYNKKK